MKVTSDDYFVVDHLGLCMVYKCLEGRGGLVGGGGGGGD